MDEIVGVIVEQIAKNAREAAKRRAAALPAATIAGNARARQAQIAAALGTPAPAAVPASPPVAAVSTTPGPAPDPFASGGGLLGSSAILGGDSPFGGLPMPGEALPVMQPDSLLAAFPGGAAFLGAFVVSEALAPPLALREPRRT